GAAFFGEYPDYVAGIGLVILLSAGLGNVLSEKLKIVWKPLLFFFRTVLCSPSGNYRFRGAFCLLERAAYGGDGFGSLAAIGASALGHVRPAATTLPAQRTGRQLDQIARGIARGEIIGHAHRNRALAVVALEHDGHHARADPLLFGIDKALDVPGGDTFDGAAHIDDAIDGFVGRRRGTRTAAAA